MTETKKKKTEKNAAFLLWLRYWRFCWEVC